MNGKQIQIIDRSDMTKLLNERLEIDPKTTAIVAVDMHRGHLDPAVATLPVPEDECRRVISNTKELFDLARAAKIPIIHVIVTVRKYPEPGAEHMINPFWRALEELSVSITLGRRSIIRSHNIEGSVQTEIIPELKPLEGEYIINNKKRLSIFYGTDLKILLHTLKVDTLILVGVTTNACIQCAAFDALNRDYKVVVISDCVATGEGEDLHIFALQNIARCLGWVLTLGEFQEKIAR